MRSRRRTCCANYCFLMMLDMKVRQEWFVHGKGNRSLPWSDEDDWEFGPGGLEGMGRPGCLKDRRGLGEPGRSEEVGISVEVVFEDFGLTECGRPASNQLVHACAGNPVPPTSTT